MCAALYAEGCRQRALFTERAGDVGGAVGAGEDALCVLPCMLEVVEGALCLLNVLEVLRCRSDTLCATLYAGGPEGELCLLEVMEALELLELQEAPDVIR